MSTSRTRRPFTKERNFNFPQWEDVVTNVVLARLCSSLHRRRGGLYVRLGRSSAHAHPLTPKLSRMSASCRKRASCFASGDKIASCCCRFCSSLANA